MRFHFKNRRKEESQNRNWKPCIFEFLKARGHKKIMLTLHLVGNYSMKIVSLVHYSMRINLNKLN